MVQQGKGRVEDGPHEVAARPKAKTARLVARTSAGVGDRAALWSVQANALYPLFVRPVTTCLQLYPTTRLSSSSCGVSVYELDCCIVYVV